MADHKACVDVERHRILHRHLDELLACWLEHNGRFQTNVMTGEWKGLSNTTVMELMQWSAKMADIGAGGEPLKSEGGTGH